MPPWGPDLKNTNYSILFYSYIVMCKFLFTMYIHFRSLTEQIRTFHTATSITTELSHVLADLRVTGFPMKRKITFSTSLYTNNMLLFIYYILSGISTEERFRKTADIN
jgi:hypothetical protein